MKKMFTAGSGESLLTTPLDLRIALENTEVTLEEATLLVNTFSIFFKRKKPIEIVFGKPGNTCQTWGTAFVKEGRIKINRPSIPTLLHEMAHIFTKDRGHGIVFAKTLDTCYGLYFIYLKTKMKEKKEERKNL